ncbi:hypothetical protein H0H92_009638 [Tricholoma furcatifolium]|nr:hypothetical protein H0H92_009638 [Tricholoma furcatifolium]
MASTTKNFSLSGRGLKLDTRADLEPILATVDPTVIEEIHFGGNTLGVEASQALGEFLAKTTVLKVADFADIFTGRLISEIPLALSAICDALKDKTSLVELNLSDNAFGGRSVDPIVPFLVENRSFQVLKLNNNGLGPAGGVVLANALLKSAEKSKEEGKKSNLRTVICGRNRLENGSAPAWAEAFAAHGTLVEVRMPQNGIRMEGITALARGLSKCPHLEYIDLQDNTFTVDGKTTGLEAWSEAVLSWPELHTVNLSDCFLSADGEVPSLLSAFASGTNPKLHTLQLQNNNLESQTFQLFSENISTKMLSVMSLDLLDNDQEEEDEHLETIALSMKQRGGRLYAYEEEEEEEEEEEKEAEEVESEAKGIEAAAQEPSKTDKAADELADMLNKVKISNE